MTTFDAGRGCPFQCSFCTIIDVQGRVSRRRTADDVEAIIRHNAARGVQNFFITDDNFARNKDWEAIFDRIVVLREQQGFNIKLTIQVDTLCHRIPHFIDKAGRAGVVRVFIGLEGASRLRARQGMVLRTLQQLAGGRTADHLEDPVVGQRVGRLAEVDPRMTARHALLRIGEIHHEATVGERGG